MNRISYDTSKRKWNYEPIDGEIQEYDAGAIGKNLAVQAKIKNESSEIYSMLRYLSAHTNDPDIERRAIDGATLSIDQLVIQKAENDHESIFARVANPDKTIEYIISPGPARSIYRCSCPDYENGVSQDSLPIGDPNRPHRGAPYVINGGIMCKHIWAYHFSKMTKTKLASENPASEYLSEMFQKAFIPALANHEALHKIALESKVFAFGCGNVSIAIPITGWPELSEDNKEVLNKITMELTSKSLELVIY